MSAVVMDLLSDTLSDGCAKLSPPALPPPAGAAGGSGIVRGNRRALGNDMAPGPPSLAAVGWATYVCGHCRIGAIIQGSARAGLVFGLRTETLHIWPARKG